MYCAKAFQSPKQRRFSEIVSPKKFSVLHKYNCFKKMFPDEHWKPSDLQDSIPGAAIGIDAWRAQPPHSVFSARKEIPFPIVYKEAGIRFLPKAEL